MSSRFLFALCALASVSTIWLVNNPEGVEDLFAPEPPSSDAAEPFADEGLNEDNMFGLEAPSKRESTLVDDNVKPADTDKPGTSPKPQFNAKPVVKGQQPEVADRMDTANRVAVVNRAQPKLISPSIAESPNSHYVPDNLDQSVVAPPAVVPHVSASNCPPVITHRSYNCQTTYDPGYQVQNNYSPATQYSINNNSIGAYRPATYHPAMNVGNYTLFQYRRMMRNHSAPHPSELQGTWRGINKGIATAVIDERFIKQFQYVNGRVYGDNISVEQHNGQPIYNHATGGFQRVGKFQVQNPRGIGAFRHGAILSYRHGGNRLLDPANLIEDKLVKLDDNHMLGRATANFGPIKIPLAFFVLERVQ